MPLAVVCSTEPSHVERLQIVVMMRVRFQFTADFARFRNELATTNGVTHHGFCAISSWMRRAIGLAVCTGLAITATAIIATIMHNVGQSVMAYIALRAILALA